MPENLWSLSGRLQLFWDTPIVAGTAFAMIPAWFRLASVGRGENRWKRLLVIGSFLLELAVLACLVLTQSRGPLLAWLVATAGGMAFALMSASPLRREMVIRSSVALILVVLGALLTTVRERLVAGVLLQDQSVGNRLQIWSASLDMLWLNPWVGLGAGEAGWTYSQWFQPDTTRYLYTGVLNSFFEIGIERGVIVLWLILAGIATIAMSPWFVCRSENSAKLPPAVMMLGLCSWGSLVAYFVANLSSSLHQSPTLIVLAVGNLAAFLVFVILIRGWLAIGKAALCSALPATVLLLLLWLLPRFHQREITVAFDQGAVVLHKTDAPANSQPAVVLVDRAVLGPLFGGELRKFLMETPVFTTLLVFDPRHPMPRSRLESANRTVMTGRSVRFLSELDPKRPHELLILNPEGPPIGFPPSWTVRVLLPGGDELGQNTIWLAAARTPGVTIRVSGAGGQLLVGGNSK